MNGCDVKVRPIFMIYRQFQLSSGYLACEYQKYLAWNVCYKILANAAIILSNINIEAISEASVYLF